MSAFSTVCMKKKPTCRGCFIKLYRFTVEDEEVILNVANMNLNVEELVDESV